MEAYDENEILKAVYRFDTTTIADKDSGTFYYPDQPLYVNDSVLNSEYTYKLFINNPETGKEVTSETSLVHDFYVDKPNSFQTIRYDPGKTSKCEWTTAEGGKLYQVIVRFFYSEKSISDPSYNVLKYVDWKIITGVKSTDDEGGDDMVVSYANDGFYNALHANIPVDPDKQRSSNILQYHFIVAGDDLNSYIEVSQPSNSIIQEKPTYTNIVNGIGLFSARYTQVIDSIRLSEITKEEIRENDLTKDLGF